MRVKIKLLVLLLNFMILNTAFSQVSKDNAIQGTSGKTSGSIKSEVNTHNAFAHKDYPSNSIYKQNYWTAMVVGKNKYGNKIIVIARNYKHLDDAVDNALWISKQRGYDKVYISKRWCINITEKLLKEKPFPYQSILTRKIEKYRNDSVKGIVRSAN